MNYQAIYLFVEGDDDERFIRYHFYNHFDNLYNYIQFVQYAREKKDKITEFIDSVKSMNAEYLFFTDINRSPCVTSKKKNLIRQYGNLLERDKIIVVILMIEGWYLAGLTAAAIRRLKIKEFPNTDNIDKQQFKALFPEESIREFKSQILENYSTLIAQKKNVSFKYFYTKFIRDRTP